MTMIDKDMPIDKSSSTVYTSSWVNTAISGISQLETFFDIIELVLG